MHREDRLYLQLIIGIGIGVILGLVAFILVTGCRIESICEMVGIAEGSPEVRLSTHENRLVPQSSEANLEAIVVEWVPKAQAAMTAQVDKSFGLDGGVLVTGHQLSTVPDSITMRVDTETLDYLIMLNEESVDRSGHNWGMRDWMIVTGGYNLLTAATFDAKKFTEAGYDIQVFFRGDEFRTAIVGYDSAEAATLDLVKIRAELRSSAKLSQTHTWCGEMLEYTQFVECITQE